jgi:hypothetical protein
MASKARSTGLHRERAVQTHVDEANLKKQATEEGIRGVQNA